MTKTASNPQGPGPVSVRSDRAAPLRKSCKQSRSGMLWTDEIRFAPPKTPWLKPLFVGIYRGIPSPGFLGWCLRGFRRAKQWTACASLSLSWRRSPPKMEARLKHWHGHRMQTMQNPPRARDPGSPGIEPRTVEPNRTNRTVCEPLFSQIEPNRTVQRKATESLGLELGEEPESRSSAAQLVQFSACQNSDDQKRLNVELSLGPAPSSYASPIHCHQSSAAEHSGGRKEGQGLSPAWAASCP